MKKVLFICTGNYYRSRMAEEIFNYLARKQGLHWQAHSAGLRSDMSASPNEGPISKHAITCLTQAAYPILSRERYPRSVQPEDFEHHHLVIALNKPEHWPMMLERFPAFAEEVQYWMVADIDELLAAEAFVRIERKVKDLLSKLQ